MPSVSLMKICMRGPSHFSDMIGLFEKIEIEVDTKKSSKPIQTGIVMATTAMLHVQKLLLEDLAFSFLCFICIAFASFP